MTLLAQKLHKEILYTSIHIWSITNFTMKFKLGLLISFKTMVKNWLLKKKMYNYLSENMVQHSLFL